MSNATLRADICNAIVTKYRDPADWLLAVRDIVEALGLNPARCLQLSGSLETVVNGVLDEAYKQGRTEERVRAAV